MFFVTAMKVGEESKNGCILLIPFNVSVNLLNVHF